MRVTFSTKGDFKKTRKFLEKNRVMSPEAILHKYGLKGVEALRAATPKDTGETANSWSYEIVKTSKGYSLEWRNSHMAGTVPVAVLLQYGHGTRGGTYVEGIDFINPAMKEHFDGLAYDIWKEVTNR